MSANHRAICPKCGEIMFTTISGHYHACEACLDKGVSGLRQGRLSDGEIYAAVASKLPRAKCVRKAGGGRKAVWKISQLGGEWEYTDVAPRRVLMSECRREYVKQQETMSGDLERFRIAVVDERIMRFKKHEERTP